MRQAIAFGWSLALSTFVPGFADTTRVSVDSAGNQADGGSFFATVSANGRFVAFSSAASNLVPGDTNGWIDEFLHDRSTGKTERVSVSSSGAQSDGGSYGSVVSADGRFVAFYSEASNLAAGDTNGVGDVFIRDRRYGTTVLACFEPVGQSANATNELHSISADGRFVTFGSPATNLVAGGTNGQSHVHLLDRDSGTIELVSVASDGSQGNGPSHSSAASRDGRYVVFSSNASNLVLATPTPRRMPSSGIAISGSPRA